MNSELDAQFRGWWQTVGQYLRSGPSADIAREAMYKAYCAGRIESADRARQALTSLRSFDPKLADHIEKNT